MRTALAVAVTAAAGALLLVCVAVPRLGGATPYVILTGSMAPGMPPGTLVVARPVRAEALGPGTVITYQLASGRPTVVTHRIVAQGISATGETVFRTQGDANAAVDSGWVRPVQVRGARWYAVPYVGVLTSRIGATDRQVAERVVEAGLAAYAVAMLLGTWQDRRRRVEVAAR